MEVQIQEQTLKREQNQLISDNKKLQEERDKLQKRESENETRWSECQLEAEKVCTVNHELERQIKVATKQLETKTALKKEVEKLKGTVKELKDSRAADTKKATQDAAEKEKVHEQDAKAVMQAHERKIEQLRETHKREQEARQTTYYAESKAMIIGHQHSLGLGPPSKAVEDFAKDDGIDLASMIRTLMASHVRDRTAAKSLKEEVGRLRDQVANYESYKQTDFGIVQALMEKMEGCTEPGHQTLKSLFGRREYPAL
jgi:sugar-specific transcriptional regulator TrmB